MYGYVYKTTNLLTNKIYVGQHKSQSFDESYYGSGKILRAEISVHGIENFKCEVLQECNSEEELNTAEILWIKELDSRNSEIGYNLASGGSFGDSGYHLGMVGKTQSEKQKKSVSNYMKNRIVSDFTKQRMSNSKIGNTNASGNKGYIHIYKDDQEIKIKPEQLDDYIKDGWKQGHKPYSEEFLNTKKERYKNSIYIVKDGVIKSILSENLEEYLDNGWLIGKGEYSEERKQKISLAQKGRICVTDGEHNKYINKDDLQKYLDMGYLKMTTQKYKQLYE